MFPKIVDDILTNKDWKNAMKIEMVALGKNKTLLTMDGVYNNLMPQMPFCMTILRKKFTWRSHLGLKLR